MAHYDCKYCGAGIYAEHSKDCYYLRPSVLIHAKRKQDTFSDKPSVGDIGLRPKSIAYNERLKEINEAFTRYLQIGEKIPQEWVDEFSILNSEL